MSVSTSLPAVTVVIPAYNLRHYLRDAVQSVRCQTYGGTKQIIILNDGSTDDTLQIAQDLATEFDNITVHTQENQGRAKTRDRLLRLAETEFIAWLDADDIAAPSWLEDQIAYLAAHDECGAVSGQAYAMNDRCYPISPLDRHPLEHEQIDQRHISGQANAFLQSCVVTRKSKLIEAGGYRPEYPAAEDFDLWLRLAEVSQLANLDRIHLYYRVHSTAARWTINVGQREQAIQILRDARQRRGLDQPVAPSEPIPPAKKDDWNSRVYWIIAALRSGNPKSAIGLIGTACKRHPGSLLIWILLVVAACDCVLFLGNRNDRFAIGKEAVLRGLPTWSIYRLGRFLNRKRRQLFA